MTLGLTAWTRPSTANPQSLSLQQTWTCSWAWSPAQLASQVALEVSAGDVRDMGSIPGLGRSPGGGHGNPFQYSCLENPTDRGAWWAIVRRVAKSWTQLKQLSMHVCMCCYIFTRGLLCAGCCSFPRPTDRCYYYSHFYRGNQGFQWVS